MKKYFVLKRADYGLFENFAADIVAVLNRNFSALSDEQQKVINEHPNGKSLLTFPEQPFAGDKYIINRYGKSDRHPEKEFFLGCNGEINPVSPKASEQTDDDYWERTENIQLGHRVTRLSEEFLTFTKFLVALSGYSESTISVEITRDRFGKPQAAVCRLTTPGDYYGNYAKHFMAWADIHNLNAKDGRW